MQEQTENKSGLRKVAKQLVGHAVAMFAFGVMLSVFVLANTASNYNVSDAKTQGVSVQQYVQHSFITFVLVWAGISILWLLAIAAVKYRRGQHPNDKKGSADEAG